MKAEDIAKQAERISAVSGEVARAAHAVEEAEANSRRLMMRAIYGIVAAIILAGVIRSLIRTRSSGDAADSG